MRQQRMGQRTGLGCCWRGEARRSKVPTEPAGGHWSSAQLAALPALPLVSCMKAGCRGGRRGGGGAVGGAGAGAEASAAGGPEGPSIPRSSTPSARWRTDAAEHERSSAPAALGPGGRGPPAQRQLTRLAGSRPGMNMASDTAMAPVISPAARPLLARCSIRGPSSSEPTYGPGRGGEGAGATSGRGKREQRERGGERSPGAGAGGAGRAGAACVGWGPATGAASSAATHRLPLAPGAVAVGVAADQAAGELLALAASQQARRLGGLACGEGEGAARGLSRRQVPAAGGSTAGSL
jgi:hypothetical protein